MSRLSFATLKHFDRKVYLLLGSMYLNRLGFFISFPYLAFYLTYLHFTPLMVGIVVSAQATSYSLSSILCGYVSDRFSKKRSMVISMLVSSIASYAFTHANTACGYILLSTLLGLSRSLFDVAMPAYLTEVIDKKHHHLIFNLRFLIINAAGAMGPLIGVYFASQHSNAVFNISAMLCLFNALLIQHQLPNTISIEKKLSSEKINFIHSCRTLINDKALLFIVIATMLYWFIYMQQEAPLAQILQLRDPKHATWLFGLMWIINTVMIVLLQLPLTAITKNISMSKLINIAGLFFIMAFIGLAFYIDVPVFAMSITLITLGEMLITPIANVIVADISPPSMRATYFGALSLSTLGWAIGPIVGGLIIEYFPSEALFLTMALLSVGMVVLYHLGLKAASSKAAEIHDIPGEEKQIIEN